jgi:SAM-dependent methyltransferase
MAQDDSRFSRTTAFEDRYHGTLYHHTLSGDAMPDRLRAVLERVGSGRKVLEVGCHTGFFSALLRGQGCSVVGVELNPDAAALAAAVVDELITANIEDASTWERVPWDLDVALFIDVLEHLVDPWRALRRTREHLGPQGRVLASLPNVACWSIRRELLRGRFVPPETGLYDPSHLRFFTLNDARQLLEDAGFVVTSCLPLWTAVPLMYRLQVWPALANLWRSWWVAHHPNLSIAVPLFEARLP